jgi:hypothetical protein
MPGRLLDGVIDLTKPPVEVADLVDLDVDLGRKRCVLRLERRGRLSPLAHVGRHQLRVHTGEAEDEQDESGPPELGG